MNVSPDGFTPSGGTACTEVSGGNPRAFAPALHKFELTFHLEIINTEIGFPAELTRGRAPAYPPSFGSGAAFLLLLGFALKDVAGQRHIFPARLAAYQQESDPAAQFLVLVRAAIAGGVAHFADRQGKAPAEPLRWGWRRQRVGGRWAEQGTRLGWA